MKRKPFLACALLLVGTLHAAELSGTATVRAVRGTASFAHAPRAQAKLFVGHVLPEGTSIRSEKDSSVDLFLKHFGAVRLQAGTTLELSKLRIHMEGPDPVKAEAILEVKQGSILAGFKASGPPITYELRTPTGVFRTMCADFRLDASGEFRVLTGSVSVESNGKTAIIKAGEKGNLTGPPRLAGI